MLTWCELLKNTVTLNFLNKNSKFSWLKFFLFILQLEKDQLDKITTISLLKDKIAGLEDNLNVKSQQLTQSTEDTSQFRTEFNTLR